LFALARLYGAKSIDAIEKLQKFGLVVQWLIVGV
jgi:hypothetical protein